jgi:hypothetical protein
MSKIWEIYGEKPKADENPEFILREYADQLKKDTESKFVGIVTETIHEDSGSVTYALYILVPELKDYMYRLIEINTQDLATPYPVEMRLFAKDPKNHRTFFAEDANDYRTKLESMIKSPVTKGILMHLKTLIEIKNDY